MKKLMAITGLLLFVVVLLSISCATAVDEGMQSRVETDRDFTGAIPQEEMGDWEEIPPPEVIVSAPSTSLSTGEPWAEDRMIVRTADISLAVEDVSEAIDEITVIADSLDGYVVSSRVWKERERLAGSISIRVPVENFNDAMRQLRGLAVDVTSERTSSQDVTEEYVDLSAQLKNLEATEEQLLAIMEKAETVEEILEVQRELSRTRGEIEQTKARMQYLEQTSSTSLINIQLEQSKLAVEFAGSTTTVKEREKIRLYADVGGGFPPYSYEWDLGDGTTSTDVSPVHTYKDDGTYTISLTVTDDRGNTATETRTDYITVIPGWSAGSIANSAWDGLVTFGHILVDILIWIGIFSPVWIVIGGVIIYWRRRRKKAADSTILPEKR